MSVIAMQTTELSEDSNTLIDEGVDDADGQHNFRAFRTNLPVFERYKYKVVCRDWETIGEFVKKMNRLGYHGWEIIDISRDLRRGDIEEVVLKRYYEPKKHQDDE